MKITQTRLKQIIQEEVAAVAAEGWEHAQADTTAAAASRDIDINQTYEDVLHLSSYLDTEEERNLLQQAAEILKNYSGALEEGELEEGAGQVYCKDRKAPGGFRRQPPCPPGYDQQQVADKKTGPAGGVEQSRRDASGPKPSRWE